MYRAPQTFLKIFLVYCRLILLEVFVSYFPQHAAGDFLLKHPFVDKLTHNYYYWYATVHRAPQAEFLHARSAGALFRMIKKKHTADRLARSDTTTQKASAQLDAKMPKSRSQNRPYPIFQGSGVRFRSAFVKNYNFP